MGPGAPPHCAYFHHVVRAPHRLTNDEIAELLDEVAALLETQEASPWRVRAYREVARTLRVMKEPVVDVLDREGRDGLVALPTIGRSIAAAIEEMAWRGRFPLLDRLRGETTPVELLMTLPGLGEALATRIHDALGVETLEELEVAAHDGRLERLRGFGPRRAQAVRDLLAAQLGRSTRRRARRIAHDRDAEPPPIAPSIELLLDLDEEYRRRASRGQLQLIAPRRFNPRAEPWLPIWHAVAEGWHFTLVYSNSATAHRLERTDDWVVLYWERDGHEDQATVVTEHRGPLRGRRVVRGRERACLEHWARRTERERDARRYAR